MKFNIRSAISCPLHLWNISNSLAIPLKTSRYITKRSIAESTMIVTTGMNQSAPPHFEFSTQTVDSILIVKMYDIYNNALTANERESNVSFG